jgi:hypothetical protein
LTPGKEFFAESFFFCSRRKNYSLRVLFFAENIIFYSRQRDLRREHEIKLSPKNIALGEASVSVVMASEIQNLRQRQYACSELQAGTHGLISRSNIRSNKPLIEYPAVWQAMDS